MNGPQCPLLAQSGHRTDWSHPKGTNVSHKYSAGQNVYYARGQRLFVVLAEDRRCAHFKASLVGPTATVVEPWWT